MNNYTSFPQVTLKKLTDSDEISDLKDKIQFNFDQVYLSFINKAIKGDKGDRGYPGLSIKGDKGATGATGSLVFFDNVGDGDPVTNPDAREGDYNITSSGAYLAIIDDGNGNLIYDLIYTPSLDQYMKSQAEFAALGSISNHQILSTGTGGNLVLAEKDGSDAEYYRVSVGTNTYTSVSNDTLTLVNLLDGAAAGSSTDSKQLSLRYRDLANGSESLTSFDFKYSISSNVEYKSLGDGITNINIANDNNSGITRFVDNTNQFLFTGGVSDWTLATISDSLSITKPASDEWLVDIPTGDKLNLTPTITIDGTLVGINKLAPTRELDIFGDIYAETDVGISGSSTFEVDEFKIKLTKEEGGFNPTYIQLFNDAISMETRGGAIISADSSGQLTAVSDVGSGIIADDTFKVNAFRCVEGNNRLDFTEYVSDLEWKFEGQLLGVPFLAVTIDTSGKITMGDWLTNNDPVNDFLFIEPKLRMVSDIDDEGRGTATFGQNDWLQDITTFTTGATETAIAGTAYDRVLYITPEIDTDVYYEIWVENGGGFLLAARATNSTATVNIPADRDFKIQRLGSNASSSDAIISLQSL